MSKELSLQRKNVKEVIYLSHWCFADILYRDDGPPSCINHYETG